MPVGVGAELQELDGAGAGAGAGAVRVRGERGTAWAALRGETSLVEAGGPVSGLVPSEGARVGAELEAAVEDVLGFFAVR